MENDTAWEVGRSYKRGWLVIHTRVLLVTNSEYWYFDGNRINRARISPTV